MADQLAELFVTIRANTDKLEADLNALKGKTDGVTTGFTNTTTATTNFNKSVGSGTQNLGKFANAVTNSVGVTGKLGNLLGNLGQSLLTGGVVGAGFAAAALAFTYLKEKAEKFTKAVGDAVNKLLLIKSTAEGITFNIGAENLNAQLDVVSKRKAQLDEEITARELKILKLDRSGAGAQTTIDIANAEIERRRKQITTLDELETKLKDAKASEEALGLTMEEFNAVGIKQTTTLDTIKTSLDTSKKKIDEYTLAVKNAKIGTDEWKAAKKLLADETENYNSLLGIEKDKIKVPKPPDQQDASVLFAEIEAATKANNDILLQQKQDYYNKLSEFDQAYISSLSLSNEEAYQKALELLNKEYEDYLLINENKLEVDQWYASEKAKLDEEHTQTTQKAIQDAQTLEDTWYGIAGAMGAVGSIMEQNSVEFKALATMEAIIATALAITKALPNIPLAIAVGVMGAVQIAKIIAAASGGVFEGGKKVASFAGGGDFMVPQGFNNDSFPMMVQSGERVTVTPSGRVGEESKLLAAIGGKLDALNKNLANKNMSPIIKLDIDGKQLVKQVTIPNENKLRKAGVDLASL